MHQVTLSLRISGQTEFVSRRQKLSGSTQVKRVKQMKSTEDPFNMNRRAFSKLAFTGALGTLSSGAAEGSDDKNGSSIPSGSGPGQVAIGIERGTMEHEFPLIEVEGGAFEMGRQHGEQAKDSG
jgi:hypothetical protein